MALKTVRIAARLSSGSRARAPFSRSGWLLGALPGKGVLVGVGVGDVVAVGDVVGTPAGVGAAALSEGVAGAVVGPAEGTTAAGPAAPADGVGTGVAVLAGKFGEGSEMAVSGGWPGPATGVEGASGPRNGPMFGTGGGVSYTGSTAIGRLLTGALFVSGPGSASTAGLVLAAVGVATEGAGTGVVLGFDAANPVGAVLEGGAEEGIACVAGKS